MGALSLWTGRQHIAEYIRRAHRGRADHGNSSDPGEVLSPRFAVWGFGAGSLALCAFVWQWSGGSWWLPPVFFAAYLLLMTAITRIRAETAVLATELEWVNPQTALATLVGTRNLPPADLVHMGILTWFNSDYRTSPMPHQLESMVGLRRTMGNQSASLRPFVPLLLLSALVAMVAALAWDLQLYYRDGALVGVPNQWRPWKATEPWRNAMEWIGNPKPPNPASWLWSAVGGGIVWLLSALRSRIVGFPLHPAAYVMNTSMANDQFWLDMLVAWAIKGLFLRYGGVRLYHAALPFFLGLILGDFVTGAAWSIVGAVLGLELFRTFAV